MKTRNEKAPNLTKKEMNLLWYGLDNGKSKRKDDNGSGESSKNSNGKGTAASSDIGENVLPGGGG